MNKKIAPILFSILAAGSITLAHADEVPGHAVQAAPSGRCVVHENKLTVELRKTHKDVSYDMLRQAGKLKVKNECHEGDLLILKDPTHQTFGRPALTVGNFVEKYCDELDIRKLASKPVNQAQ